MARFAPRQRHDFALILASVIVTFSGSVYSLGVFESAKLSNDDSVIKTHSDLNPEPLTDSNDSANRAIIATDPELRLPTWRSPFLLVRVGHVFQS